MTLPDLAPSPIGAPQPDGLPAVVTRLFKGVLYREADERLWQSLGELSSHVQDYVSVLGLELFLDDAEGYAFLRSRDDADADLPRLVPRRQLTFNVSLLLALLRARLAEFDQRTDETRLIMSETQLRDMLAVFLPETSNEARMLDQLSTTIKKVVELGFLRRLRTESHGNSQEDAYEVARIIKAFVDAQWLEEFDARLADYRAQLAEGDGA